jgi:hypothetical protein
VRKERKRRKFTQMKTDCYNNDRRLSLLSSYPATPAHAFANPITIDPLIDDCSPSFARPTAFEKSPPPATSPPPETSWRGCVSRTTFEVFFSTGSEEDEEEAPLTVVMLPEFFFFCAASFRRPSMCSRYLMSMSPVTYSPVKTAQSN